MTSNKSRLEIGIHDDLSNEEYHADKSTISKSHLDQVNKSPAHYRQWLTEPAEPTTAMLFGQAAHLAVLEPHNFCDVICCDASSKSTKIYKEMVEANPGKIVLLKDEYADIVNMRAVAQSHPLVSQLLSEGKAERSLVWEDKETGLRCKVRADYWRNDNIIVDYKTTLDASFREFQRSVYTYRYDVQAAMYLHAVSAQSDKPLDKFVLIAQEKKAPYAIAVYVLDDATLEVGEKKMRKNLNTLAECFRTDQWPSYPVEFQAMNLPAYAWNEE